MLVCGIKEWKNQSSVWEPFPRYSVIIKIAILGYENEVLFEKIYRSCIWTLFLPQGVKIELIFALRAAVSEIRADFQNWRIWAWNLEFEKSTRSCIGTIVLPQGVEIELILLYGQRFPAVGARRAAVGRFSKLPYLGMKPGIWKKCCICTLFLYWAYFRSTSSRFRDRAI